jgi:hypothetical protein
MKSVPSSGLGPSFRRAAFLSPRTVQHYVMRTTKYASIVVIAVTLALVFGGCVELHQPDATWEAPGPIKVRIARKYSLGNDYFFFDALDVSSGRWNRVMSVWRDATGSMPVESIRSVDSRIGYLFLVDQVAATTDGGRTWSVFNTSKFFNCRWDGCAAIKDVSLSTAGVGALVGSRRVGTQRVEFKLGTKDFGRTWRPNNGA